MRLTLFISMILIAANSIAQDTLLLGHTIPEIVFEDRKNRKGNVSSHLNKSPLLVLKLFYSQTLVTQRTFFKKMVP